MQRDQFLQLYTTAAAADATTRERAVVVDAIAAVTRMVAWCESQQLVYAQALAAMGAPAESVIAQTARSNSRDAERVVQRARTAQAAPAVGDALATGRVATGHLDLLTSSLRRLDAGQRATLLADTARLVTIAAQTTPDEFARTLRAEERRLATDDGMSRLERQRTLFACTAEPTSIPG